MTNQIKARLHYAALITTTIFITVSCGEITMQDDSKKAAEEQNEENFKNNAQENDAQFLVNAAEIHLEEILLGKLAQTKGNLPEVKELGKMMESEHTKLSNDLKKLANQKLVMLPSTPTENAQNAYNILSNKKPAEFDKEFCKMMISGHENAITLFEKASAGSTDEDIKSWAAAKLPALKTHLDHSITCQEKCEKL